MTVDLAIDHLVVVVPDLEAARAAFGAAGFTATPIARHSETMGTANSCIMLDGRYIELMGIVADTPANEGWRSLLASGAGLKGIALATSDIAATAALLADLQIRTEPARHFSRAMPEGDLRFSVIRLPRDLTPGLQCICCQHHTRDLLWTPASMRHANGATHIIAASAPGVDALASLGFAPSAATIPVSAGEAGITIALGPRIADRLLLDIEAATGVSIMPRYPS